jgi:hypothetical protein
MKIIISAVHHQRLMSLTKKESSYSVTLHSKKKKKQFKKEPELDKKVNKIEIVSRINEAPAGFK